MASNQFNKFSSSIWKLQQEDTAFFHPPAVSYTSEFQGSLKQELGMNLPLF